MRAIRRIAVWLGGMVIAALLPLLMASDANAASFDCAKAKSVEEKAICADPKLSKLDEQMDAAYRVTLKTLSPQGQIAVRDGQRQWIKYGRAVCAKQRAELPKSSACLVDVYGARLEDLKNVTQKIGPFIFSRIDTYAFIPCGSSEDDDCEFGDGSSHRGTFWRIDSPATPGAKRWNSLVSEMVAQFGAAIPGMYNDPSLDVYGASRDLVSAYFSQYRGYLGAAHGWADGRAYNVLLKTGMPLQTYDLFDIATDWSNFLLKRVTGTLEPILQAAQKENPVEKFFIPPDSEILPIVENPERWRLTSVGLEIALTTFFSGSADTPGKIWVDEITIPWTDLRPYLQKPLPFQLPQ